VFRQQISPDAIGSKAAFTWKLDHFWEPEFSRDAIRAKSGPGVDTNPDFSPITMGTLRARKKFDLDHPIQKIENPSPSLPHTRLGTFCVMVCGCWVSIFSFFFSLSFFFLTIVCLCVMACMTLFLVLVEADVRHVASSGMFATTKQWWKTIKGMDNDLSIWGGENIVRPSVCMCMCMCMCL
jgi:hypothetical protein